MTLALLFVLFIPHPWIGNTFHPGQKVTFSYHGKIKPGTPDVQVTIVDEKGFETITDAAIIHPAKHEDDLTFVCPTVKQGYYEIAQISTPRQIQYGHIDGRTGFYVESNHTH